MIRMIIVGLYLRFFDHSTEVEMLEEYNAMADFIGGL